MIVITDVLLGISVGGFFPLYRSYIWRWLFAVFVKCVVSDCLFEVFFSPYDIVKVLVGFPSSENPTFPYLVIVGDFFLDAPK